MHWARLNASRQFTTSHPFHLASRSSSSRPQVPFLADTSTHPRRVRLQRQVARVLSTENKEFVKRETRWGIKLGIGAFVLVNLVVIGAMTYNDELIERKRPSPPGWSYLTRSAWRGALSQVETSQRRGALPDYGRVSDYWLSCIRRLEDPTIDGKDVAKIPIDLSDTSEAVRGVERFGIDVGRKSEEWKSGYVEAILEAGRLAELSQSLVYDAIQRKFFPETTVVGPSNPRPRPVGDGETPPREENCTRAMPDPQLFYDRVIYGVGFTTKQRLDVIHAAANWLHFSKLEDRADKLYTLALAEAQKYSQASSASLSASAVPSPSSANTLTALKQHASHLARTGRVADALPIFLTSLHSLQTNLSKPNTYDAQSVDVAPEQPTNIVSEWSQKLFRQDIYPLPATTGDEPLSTLSRNESKCLEAELMMYIGEILYSSSPKKRKDGIAWTREATEIAADTLSRVQMIKEATKNAETAERITGLNRQADKSCKQCLGAAARNWEAMIEEMARDAEQDIERSTSSRGWSAWFSSDASKEKDLVNVREQEDVLEGIRSKLVREGVVDSAIFVQTGI